MEAFDIKTDEVDITITAPSDNEMNGSGSSDEEGSLYEDEDGISSTSSDKETSQKAEIQDEKRSANGEETGEELSQDFENNVSLNEEKPSQEEKEKKGIEQNYEIVGDRVLVERDGKFELVDANEIKAEYFEMLGIKSKGSPEGGEGKDKTDISSKEEPVKARPKTTPARGTRGTVHERSKRAQSSWGERYKNSEYSKIRSPYGLSEKQLEIKRKREEAIAKRKKEEEERSKEEEKRKRDDAERAFQAWLSSKKEEEKERRRLASKEQNEEDEKRASESEKAFKAWKAAKKKQQHEEREAETRRMEETASMYVVHDRGSCEEAYKRWLKKKKEDKRVKELEKKKGHRPKSKRKPKEPLPINSEKIRFTDNYGYRNTVVC